MKNPNAIAVWVASHAVIAVEQLVQTYLHRQLPPYWATEATADVATVVLYVGRNGMKAAAGRVWQTVKHVVFGPAAPATSPPSPPAA